MLVIQQWLARFSFDPWLWAGWYMFFLPLLLVWQMAKNTAWFVACAESEARLCLQSPASASQGVDWSYGEGFVALLLGVWFIAFGLRWGWLRWKMNVQRERIYDFPSDEFEVLMSGWRRLQNRQLLWWVGGTLWCLLHGAFVLLWLLHDWLFVLMALDIVGLLVVCTVLALGRERFCYSLLAEKSRMRLQCIVLFGWLVAVLWLVLEVTLLVGEKSCGRMLDCYAAYPLLQGDAFHWAVAGSFVLLTLQLVLWLLVMVAQYVYVPRLEEVHSYKVVHRLFYVLQFGLPLLWFGGMVATMPLRVLASLVLALSTMLLLGLCIQLLRALPTDSLRLRLTTDERFRYWLQTVNLYHFGE